MNSPLSEKSLSSCKLDSFTKGWFVGNFNPTLCKTEDVEVAVKHYKKGDNESSHYHKVATEITVICQGSVKMNDQIFSSGDIITIPPLQKTDFHALEDTITCVVKIPGASNDKYVD